MILYVNGCSHSEGHCQTDSRKTYSHIVACSLFGKNNFHVLRNNKLETSNPDMFSNFNQVICEPLKSPKENYLIFQAYLGKSNDRIFFESVNFLYECLKYNIKIDFSIVQWSGPNRTIRTEPIEGNHCNIVDINPHNAEAWELKFEPFASIQTMQYMLILQELYEKHNINYCFIPYMELEKKSSIENFMYHRLNFKKFTVNPTEGYRNYFRKKGWVCDSQGHPSDYANYFMSMEALKILGYEDSIIGLYDYYDTYNIKNYQNHTDKLEPHFVKNNFNKLGDATLSIIEKIKNLI